MQQLTFTKKLGATLIIAGTSIGAGMLALPMITAASGFKISLGLLLITWALMAITAQLITEINLHFRSGTNFNSMAAKTLGLPGQIITWLSYVLLLYSLSAAYIAGGSEILDNLLNTSTWQSAIIIILVLGSFIYWGLHAVDHLNKLLITIKAILFFTLAIVISPYVSIDYLNTQTPNINYLWYSFPILITSFGFHIVIPSIRRYFGDDKANFKSLRMVVFIGSTIPLFIYILWEILTLGTIPLFGMHSFQMIIDHGDSINGLIGSLEKSLNIGYIARIANAFTSVAITTSFLGVTMGLYHFNQDTYKLNPKKHLSRIIAFVITYLPPLIFVLFYPRGFVLALGYASIFVAILLIILPVLMVWKIRNQTNTHTFTKKLVLILVFLVGLIIIGLQIATSFDLLPYL
ncbi:amino acid transporter [Thiotrichales bacterium 19S3-7]|nr:amino acid transporter [Thiotrichales bacterium 19S3-7]MCF6803004.1 amino acid transporter [Thiotrichales bacterium 19S3-11]